MTAFLLVQPANAADAKAGYKTATSLQQNTVRIEADFGEETENGFGFIVGERDGMLYAVTAYHVVAKTDEVNGPEAQVTVELFDRQGKPIEAELLGTHDESNDLAVITFPAPSGFKWNRKSLGSEKDQERLTDVWFVGKNGKWSVPTSPGTISSDEPLGGRIEVDNLDVRPGSSGGPLIAASGIVGMVLADSVDNAHALSVQIIRLRLKNWQHPFTLQPGAPPRAEAVEAADPEGETIAKGEAIAARDPLFAALRELLPEGPTRRGYDLGMALAEGQTAWGPGKQAKLETLQGEEQEGFRIATYFLVDRNKNDTFASIGAAIAEADPVVGSLRTRNADPRYWLGFDIATGIFGDPKLGAQGNTASGPGSLGIRDSLMSPLAQRGFNASMTYHINKRR